LTPTLTAKKEEEKKEEGAEGKKKKKKKKKGGAGGGASVTLASILFPGLEHEGQVRSVIES
jgi:hypothetical protein